MLKRDDKKYYCIERLIISTNAAHRYLLLRLHHKLFDRGRYCNASKSMEGKVQEVPPAKAPSGTIVQCTVQWFTCIWRADKTLRKLARSLGLARSGPRLLCRPTPPLIFRSNSLRHNAVSISTNSQVEDM